MVNSALPFVLFSIAALAINAGLSSIFNATAPLRGALFLSETVTPAMGLGCAVILLGTALTTGVLRWPGRQAA